MAEPRKNYVVAEKRTPASEPPASLEDMLNALNGVEVIGVNYGRAQVKATTEGAQLLRADLGDWVHVEELADRDLPEG